MSSTNSEIDAYDEESSSILPPPMLHFTIKDPQPMTSLVLPLEWQDHARTIDLSSGYDGMLDPFSLLGEEKSSREEMIRDMLRILGNN